MLADNLQIDNEPEELIQLDTDTSDEHKDDKNRTESDEEQPSENIVNKELPEVKQCVRYKKADADEWKKCVVLNRWGNLPGKRKYKHVLNIKDLGDNKVECVDWLNEVKDWTPLEQNQLQEGRDVDENILVASTAETGYEDAMNKELNSWKKLNVYDEVKDEGQGRISVRWVLTEKEVDNNKIKKARLVARGYEELNEDIPTDSPTCNKESIRIVLAVIASMKWNVNLLDIATAFLQGKNLDRNIYLKPPKQANSPGVLWKLNKCVYGLDDASRFWYFRIREELNKLGCKMSKFDSAVFTYFTDILEGILVVHVDDFMWAGNEKFEGTVITKLREHLK